MSTVRTMADAGAVLRVARSKQNLTQAQVAERAGVSREWLNEVENGKSRFDFRRYLAVCAALDLKVAVTRGGGERA